MKLEFLYIIPIAILIILIILLNIKKRRIPLDYFLYGNKVIIIILFLIVLSLPQKILIEDNLTNIRRNVNLIYIELTSFENEYYNKILSIIEKITNAELIIRVKDDVTQFEKKMQKKQFEEYFIQKTKAFAKIYSKVKIFQKVVTDLNDYENYDKLQNLILVGDASPDIELIKEIIKESINIRFVPINVNKTEKSLQLLNYEIKNNKIIIDEPFTIQIDFNRKPSDIESGNIKLLIDNKICVFTKPIIQNNTLEFIGFREPGLHKVNIQFNNDNIIKTIMVFIQPKIFIIEGDSKSEQNADELLIILSKMTRINAVKMQNLPKYLYEYNAGFIRLSQIVSLNETDRKRIEQWIANGAGLFISYGQDIQLISEQILKFRHILPAEPVLIKEPEIPDKKSVDDLDKDKLIARVTLLLMIDNSGSMAANIGGVSRFEYVKKAAKKAVEGLSSDDYISICSFNKDVTVVLPPIPAQNKELIYRKIDNIEYPGWQTSLRRACESAIDILRKDRSAVKQLIILSDGEETVEPNHDFNISNKKLTDAEINTSVIGFGEYNPEMLRKLVTKGGIAYFQSREKDNEGFYVHKLPDWIMTDVEIAKDRLKKMYNGEIEKKDDKIDINKATMQVVKTGSFDAFWVYNPLTEWFENAEKVYRFVEMYNFPNCYTIMGVNYDGIDFPLISARNFYRGKILAFGCDFNAEFVPDWIDWKIIPKLYRNLVLFMMSESFNGLEMINYEFILNSANTVPKNSEIILRTEFIVNNLLFNLTKMNIYAINKSGIKKPAEKVKIRKSANNDIDYKIIEANFSENDLMNSENIVFEYDEQAYDMINITPIFWMNRSTEIPINKKSQLTEFKITGNQQSDLMSKSEKVIDLTLITTILCLILVLFLIDVFLRR